MEIKGRKILLFTLLLFIIRVLFFNTINVEGHSMDPTLHNNDKLLSTKVFNLKRGDIITCKEPHEENCYIIKRVIGLPGDKVEMKNDKLIINNQSYSEPYLDTYKKKLVENKLQINYSYNTSYESIALHADNFTNDFRVTVPKGKYFLLGDNRLISKDSRSFGFVSRKEVNGKIICRFYPLNNLARFY